jgi:hypothetical protein
MGANVAPAKAKSACKAPPPKKAPKGRAQPQVSKPKVSRDGSKTAKILDLVQLGTWPDFNRMIGGYFKFHWDDPQYITVKIRPMLEHVLAGIQYALGDHKADDSPSARPL